MSIRSDFLTFLTNAGFTPNRALLFLEGAGSPVEFYTSVAVGVTSSWTWITDPTYGLAFRADTINSFLTFVGASSSFLSTTAQTLIIVRRKTDVTLRNAQTFGVNGAANVSCDLYNPFGDGKVYADFGAQTAPNRLTISGYVATSSLESWIFRAGTLGSSVWKDGSELSPVNNTLITRTASAGGYFVNRGALNTGDLQEIYCIILVPFEISDAVAAQCTVDAILLGQAPPAITTTSPLPDGIVNVAYTKTFAATSGSTPYVWSVVSGAPDGLDINPSTGVFSGTPTVPGLYHVTVKVTDALVHSDTEIFELYIDDPLCIPLSIGSLTRGSFTNNSRIGPHQDSAKKVALIFRDADNAKKLTAQYSSNNGVTWTSASTAALTNNIVSHDSHQDPVDLDLIHVWTQESTMGRVAYFRFNLATGLWTLENEQVTATNTIITGAVSGTVLSPSGDPAVVYESTLEIVTAVNRNRMTYKRRVAGVWGSALPMGDIGVAQSDLFGRIIAGGSNRATMIMSVTPGYSVASTPDFQLQIIKSDGALSTISVFRTTGLLGSVPSFFLGDYTTYNNGTDLILVVPVKFGGEPTIFSFIDSDTPAVASLGEPVLGNFVAEGSFVPLIVRYVDGQLNFIDFAWANLGSQAILRYKTGASALGPFTPADMADQAGPDMGLITQTTQTADGNVVIRTCQDVDSVYIATTVAIGTIDGNTSTVKFEWLRVADLPSTPETLAAWLAGLATQEVEFCCTEPPPPPPPEEERCTHPLHRTDEYAAQSFSAGWAQTPAEPYSFSISATPPAQLQLIPPPIDVGTLDLCTVDIGPALSLNPALPVVLGIPDDLCWAVKWGALSQLLSSDGDARDPARAKYAQDLYNLAVSLGRTLISTLMVQVEDVEIPVGAIADFDQYNPEWQCVTGRPSQAAMVGANLLALAGDGQAGTGVPDDAYPITLDLARSFPVPDPADPNNTYIQLGQELLNDILGMAHHIASFKMAGPEFEATVELRNNFLRMCGRVNARLRSNAVYNQLLTQPTTRQDFKFPITVPRDEDKPGSGGGGN